MTTRRSFITGLVALVRALLYIVVGLWALMMAVAAILAPVVMLRLATGWW